MAVDPLTMQLISAGSNVLGSALKPAPTGPATSSAGQASDIRQSWDFGGWTVATGSAKADGATEGLNLPPWLLLGVAFVGAWAWIKTGKR